MTAPDDNLDTPERERADREATDWLILLQEEADDEAMRARFEEWHSASPLNADAWAETGHISALIGATAPVRLTPSPGDIPLHHAHEAGISFTRHHAADTNRTVAVKRPVILRRWLPAAALTSLAACLILITAPDIMLHAQADQMTTTGETETVRLQDGSQASLSTASAIQIAFSATERRISLLKGDAYFEVKRDPSRPFRVRAGGVETTVLGTGFEVRLRDDGTSVMVRHGRVRVDRISGTPAVSARLSAGEGIELGKSGNGARLSLRPDRVASWTAKKLIVNDRPVSEVMDEIGRWYHGYIFRNQADLARIRVTGVYDLAHPQAALDALAQAHDLRVRTITPWVSIVSAE